MRILSKACQKGMTVFNQTKVSTKAASITYPPVRNYTKQSFVEDNPASIYDTDKFDTMANIRAIRNTIFEFTAKASLPGSENAEFNQDIIDKQLKRLTIKANRSGIEDEYKDSVEQTTQAIRQLLNHHGKNISNRNLVEEAVDQLERALNKHELHMTTNHDNPMNPR